MDANKREREVDECDIDGSTKRSRVELHQLYAVVFDKSGSDFDDMIGDVYVGVPQVSVEDAIKTFIKDNANTRENEAGEIVDCGEYSGLYKFLPNSPVGVVGLELKFKEWAASKNLEVELVHKTYDMYVEHNNATFRVEEMKQTN
jgi:hypothetical protein